jgi:DNA polymerase III gamma/tau subunit
MAAPTRSFTEIAQVGQESVAAAVRIWADLTKASVEVMTTGRSELLDGRRVADFVFGFANQVLDGQRALLSVVTAASTGRAPTREIAQKFAATNGAVVNAAAATTRELAATAAETTEKASAAAAETTRKVAATAVETVEKATATATGTTRKAATETTDTAVATAAEATKKATESAAGTTDKVTEAAVATPDTAVVTAAKATEKAAETAGGTTDKIAKPAAKRAAKPAPRPATRTAAKTAAKATAKLAEAASGPYGKGSHAPLADRTETPAGFEIKGNDGSKLYHVPGSPFYKRTTAEVWFSSPEAAEAAGFKRPASQR